MTVDVHLDLAPRIVALRVRGLVAEQILVRELVEEIGKGDVELVDAVGEEGPPAGRHREALHDPLQRLHRDAAALADHVERDVARLELALDIVDRRVAALILAVGEHDQRLAAGLPAQHLDAPQQHVVERGRAPGREPIDRLDALGRIGRLASQGEDAVVEAEQRHLILRRHVAEELLDRRLHPRHRRRHAAGDVDRGDQLERHVFGREVADRLRAAVLEHVEGRLRHVAHELAVAVRDRDRHLHHVHVDALDVAHRLGAHRLHDPAAALERGHGANLMRRNRRAGVPFALERRRGERAHLASIHEEGHAGHRLGRGDGGAQQRGAGDIGVVTRRDDLHHRRVGGRLRPERDRRADARREHERRPGARADHGCSGTLRPVSGTNGPAAVAAAM